MKTIVISGEIADNNGESLMEHQVFEQHEKAVRDSEPVSRGFK